MDKTPAQIAADALTAMDRDGWCRGATTWTLGRDVYVESETGKYPVGSHCLGGLINIGMWNSPTWCKEEMGLYRMVAGRSGEMYGWELPETMDYWEGDPYWDDTRYIATWNDSSACEADVRAVLEKIAAG